MPATGELHKIRGELEIEWRIENFSTHADNENVICESIPFHFDGETWKMKLNRTIIRTKVHSTKMNRSNHLSSDSDSDDDVKKEYVSFELTRMSSGLPFNLEFSVGLKKIAQYKCHVEKHSHIFKEHSSYTIGKYVERSKLVGEDVLPSDVLIVNCILKNKERNDLTRDNATLGSSSSSSSPAGDDAESTPT